MFELSASYTDLYQLTMGQVYFGSGVAEQPVTFDYFFRKTPFDGGFVVFAGLQDLLQQLQSLRFSSEDLYYLKNQGFDQKYLNHLERFRFHGSVYSCMEGDVVFPVRPILRVEAGLLEAQLIETLLLNMLNFQSLVATKAARMRLVADDRILAEFGLRRAQGLGGYHASRAAVIGGVNSTSNVSAAKGFDLEVTGTMAHAFIQRYDSEMEAFSAYAGTYPDQTVLLVDTYDTLRSGMPNAIRIGQQLKERGHTLKGVRLDSGDLAYLSKSARKMLDEAGLQSTKIIVSNQLDEYVIRSLIQQGAPIDIFGVGTSLATGSPDAALDGVYKLSCSGGKPRIKLSETIKKVTLPDRKQVYRLFDAEGMFYGADAITLADEDSPAIIHDPFEPQKSMGLGTYRTEPQLRQVMDTGKPVMKEQTITSIADYSKDRLSLLPDEYKRFDNPHQYKIGISPKLHELRNRLITENKYE